MSIDFKLKNVQITKADLKKGVMTITLQCDGSQVEVLDQVAAMQAAEKPCDVQVTAD
jgi:hypothetical protein